MFSLVQGFYRELNHVPERRVVILGLEGAGKSTVLEWVKNPDAKTPPPSLQKLAPTVGLNVYTVRRDNVRILLWDLGGAEKLRPIWEPYIKQADAVIWVVDIADEDSIQDSAKLMWNVMGRQRFKGKPLVILANKSDKAQMNSVDLAVKMEVVKAAEERSQCVQLVSGATGAGIKDAMDWLALQLAADPSTASGMYKTCIK